MNDVKLETTQGVRVNEDQILDVFSDPITDIHEANDLILQCMETMVTTATILALTLYEIKETQIYLQEMNNRGDYVKNFEEWMEFKYKDGPFPSRGTILFYIRAVKFAVDMGYGLKEIAKMGIEPFRLVVEQTNYSAKTSKYSTIAGVEYDDPEEFVNKARELTSLAVDLKDELSNKEIVKVLKSTVSTPSNEPMVDIYFTLSPSGKPIFNYTIYDPSKAIEAGQVTFNIENSLPILVMDKLSKMRLIREV